MLLLKLLLRVFLYALFISPLATLFWGECGRDIWAESRMVPITATLLEADLKVGPMSHRTTPSANVLYRYTYDGSEYSGRNMTFCSDFSAGSVIDPFYAMLTSLKPSVGKNIEIWVDPQDPLNAVIFRYTPRWLYWLVPAIILFIFGGLRWLDKMVTGIFCK